MLTIDSTNTRDLTARAGTQFRSPFNWLPTQARMWVDAVDTVAYPVAVGHATIAAAATAASEMVSVRNYTGETKGNLCPTGRTTKRTARLLRRRRICRT